MRTVLAEDLRLCGDVGSVLNCALQHSLEVTGARLGNAQLMNWRRGYLEIEAQRGFEVEFLNFFRRVKLDHGTAYGRVLQSRRTVVVDDIMADQDFSPYREIASRAGVRAVQSTPLVSTSGALVGVLSNHFSTVGRPTELQLRELNETAELAANAIVRIRAQNPVRLVESALDSL